MEDAIRLYEMREKAMFDYTSGINSAERRGKNMQTIEITKKALKEGLSIESIHNITGLDETIIKQLKEELTGTVSV